MRLRLTRRRVVIGVILLLAMAGGGFYLDYASPSRKAERLLAEARGEPPSWFAGFVERLGLARPVTLRSHPEIAADLIALGPGAVPALLASLDSNVDRQSGAAVLSAYALGRLREPRAVAPLIRLVESDNEPGERALAGAWALGTIGDPRGLRPILTRCSHGDMPLSLWQFISILHTDEDVFPEGFYWGPVWYALSQVPHMGAPAVPTLLDSLDDPDPSVRAAAALCLHFCADPNGTDGKMLQLLREQSLVPLMDRLTDPEWRAQMYAAKAIGRLGISQSVVEASVAKLRPFVASGDPNVRYAAAVSFGALRCQESDRLLTQLTDDNHVMVRVAATQELASRRDAAAIPPLLKAMKDPESVVRRTAAKALGGLGRPGDREIIQALREAARDQVPDVRSVAIVAIGSLGDASDIARLEALPSGQFAEEASEAIARIKQRARPPAATEPGAPGRSEGSQATSAPAGAAGGT